MSIQDLYNLPISVDDAASMLRVLIPKNEKPYTTEVMRMNNRMVERWKTELLDRLQNTSGKIPSGIVWNSWMIFNDGLETRKLLSQGDNIIRPSEEEVEKWRNLFENSTITELYELGRSVLVYGWELIKTDIRLWVSQEKYNRLFYDDNVYEWYQRSKSQQDLINGKCLPYWSPEILTDVSDKITTILHLIVQPQK